VAEGLRDAERLVAPLRQSLRAGRDRLAEGLRAAGLRVSIPQGTYFLNVDLQGADAVEWCRELPSRAGVVAIPTGVFYDDKAAGRSLVRFAFCKRPEVIDEAVRRISSM
jgi:N-succinyldiaminopimelate aminotransferase